MTNDVLLGLNNRVAEACEKADLSRSDLARALGVTRSAVTQKLSGQIGFSVGDISVIADLCNVSTDYLYGRSDYAKPLEVA